MRLTLLRIRPTIWVELAQLGCHAFLGQRGAALIELLIAVQMMSDQLGKQSEHADSSGVFQLGRIAVNGAERTEKRAVHQGDRHRDIALQPIQARGVMIAIVSVFADMIDNHFLPAGAYLMAQRGFHIQLIARCQTEMDVVEHFAGDPAILGDTRHGGKAHAGGLADNVEDGRDGGNASDGVNICLKIVYVAHRRFRMLGAAESGYAGPPPW
mgnify:CR=1 FL=1